MKFYYQDKLVRTSKTHHYAFAVICENKNGFSVWACASTRELAEKARAKEIRWFENQAEGLRLHIEAIENGKKEYYRNGRYFKTNPADLESLKHHYEENSNIAKDRAATLKIVELEER